MGETFSALPERISVDPNPVAIELNAAADVDLTYKSYTRGAPVDAPPTWPIINGYATVTQVGGYEISTAPGVYPNVRLARFMTDSPKFAIYVAPVTSGSAIKVYINGKPQTVGDSVFTVSGNQFVKVTRASGTGPTEPYLVEILLDHGIQGLYVTALASAWRPEPISGTRILVVGDSYVQPSVMGIPSGTVDRKISGVYQQIAPLLGLRDIILDGQGGTGYLQPNTGAGLANYRDRTPALLTKYSPDVVIFHGGGANDLFGGLNSTNIANQMIATFTETRGSLPNAKLVFIEGFAPPAFTPATFNPAYSSLRATVQAALTGVGVYYVDVATTEPWIYGTGNTNSPTGAGNSDIYIGSDGVHYNVSGAAYIRNRLAPILRTILKDDGTKINTLIRN